MSNINLSTNWRLMEKYLELCKDRQGCQPSWLSLSQLRPYRSHVSAPAPTQVMWSNPGKVPFAWIPSHHKLSKWPIKRVQSLTDSGGDTQQHSSQLGTKIFEYSWKIFLIICLVHLWFTGWWFMCVVEIIRDLLLCVDCYLSGVVLGAVCAVGALWPKTQLGFCCRIPSFKNHFLAQCRFYFMF